MINEAYRLPPVRLDSVVRRCLRARGRAGSNHRPGRCCCTDRGAGRGSQAHHGRRRCRRPAAATAHHRARGSRTDDGACRRRQAHHRSHAAGTRGAGGTLKILYWQAPTILNTHLAQGTKDQDASRLILEPLAASGPDGVPVPLLAAEIPTVDNGGISKDQKSITWKLKPGVKWSDGTPFTADDVVFTWQYVADPKTAASTTQIADGVVSVEAKDPMTVVVTFKDPNPYPYQIFVSAQGPIIQKKQFQDFIGDKAKDAPGNLAPIGTGPYKVTDFKPGDVVTYAINDNYRDPNKPFFKDVQIKGGGDATSAARAVFQTGDVDYAWNLQVESQVLNQLMQGGKGDLAIAAEPERRAAAAQLRRPEHRRGRREGRARHQAPLLLGPQRPQGLRDGGRSQIDGRSAVRPRPARRRATW